MNWREKYRVRIGFLFGALFILRAQPRNLFFVILGLAIAALGTLLRQWAAGCVKKMDELAVQGPYALVRHPLYTGSFLMASGFVICATNFSRYYLDRTLLFWAFLWILIDSIYMPKIQKEELDLEAKFPLEYASYKQRVPAFFPRKWTFNFEVFDRQVWKKNREYGALIGFLLISILILARTFSAR